MDRRSFIKTGLIGAGGALVLPNTIMAGQQNPMAGGLYYTSEAPGRWSKKVASHLPNIEIEKTPEGTSVKVITRHTMDEYDHYIVKHMLLDSDYRFIAEKMFDPLKIKDPVSVFKLEQYSGPVYALSVCNKHDTWLSSAQV